MMKNPVQAFLDWLDTLPVLQRRSLAHLFRVCTTENIADLVSGSDKSLEEFRLWLCKEEFPIRIAARAFYVRSVFDMLLVNRETMIPGDNFLFDDKIVPLASLQWDDVFLSWKDLRHMEMSDSYIHSWACGMIKIQMEVD